MRSRINRRAQSAMVVAMLIAAPPDASAAQAESTPAAPRPDRSEIARAIDAVKADPNLATERTIKTLRWKASTPKRARPPGWFSWIAGFFLFVGESARVLVWGVALALVALLAVYLMRLARTRPGSASAETFVVPTHVHDLDIRPETLPDDIGAAARELWDRGEHRLALALLYRGMLSRLAHVHGVPIRDSSTEGDCLALATARLPEERSEYLVRLVRVWQRFRYGREPAEVTTVYRLCDEFAPALRPVSAIDRGAQRGTA